MAIQIKQALYGYGKLGAKGSEFLVVTENVKRFATKKGLKIPKLTNEALGLGPIFPGKRKRLWIDYYVAPGTKPLRVSVLERKSLRIAGK